MQKVIDKYDFFIFDLDDTIIKTEIIHYESWMKALKITLGTNFYINSNDFFSIFHSIKQDSIKDYLLNLKITNYEEVIKLKNQIYFESIIKNKDDIKMIDGCNEFINKIIENNKQFVIVSNTLKEQIDFFTELFPILKYSTKNYYREILKHKKPNPHCYLTVVEHFPNKKMVSFEDSITGIHAVSQVKQIDSYFINSPNYFHYEYIMQNYNINYILNYKL
jgi:beta-phosphoglucomutase-like phosphatase (HAD superfamily)